MKRHMLLPLFILSLMFMPALAQDESMESDGEKVPVYEMVMTEGIKPGMNSQYEEATKKWIEWMNEQGMDLTFYAWSNDDNSMNYSVFMNSPGDMEGLAGKWAQAAGGFAETEWGKKRTECVSWNKYTMWMRADELSYDPDGASDDGMNYYTAMNFIVAPANEKAWAEGVAKMKTLHAEKGVSRSWTVYRVLIGEKGPRWQIFIRAKDPADDYTYARETFAPMWDEMMPLIEDIDSAASNVWRSNGWIRDDLSKTPDKEE